MDQSTSTEAERDFSRDELLLGHTVAQTKLLHAINTSVQQNQRWRVRAFLGNGGAPAKVGAAHTGTILGIHNPTAGALNVTLVDGNDANNVVFAAPLAAGASQQLYLPFFNELWITSGGGVIIGGERYE